MNVTITQLELTLNKLLNEYVNGYTFTKNCSVLLEQLTEHMKNNTNDKLSVSLSNGWAKPHIFKAPDGWAKPHIFKATNV